MGKSSKQETTSTQNLDPQMLAYRNSVFQAATAAANKGQAYGVDPLSQQAAQQFQGYAQLGQQGAQALNGNQAALQQYMDPYEQNVINQVQGDYGRQAALTSQATNGQATAAGAFGGSRHGIAEGVALGDLSRGMGQQIAQLRSQGYNDAMQRAAQAANLGMGASGQLQQLGDYFRSVAQQNDPYTRRLQLLQQGLQGAPYGTTGQQTTVQPGNFLSDVLGLGATGAGLFAKK